MNPSETPAPTLIICRGLPASGKSTFATDWVAEDPAARSRVNRDTVRETYFNALWGETVDELAVQRIVVFITEQLMGIGRSIVVDDTNLPVDRVRLLATVAEIHGYRIEVREFDAPLEELIARDDARAKKVGGDVITMLRDRYFTNDRMPVVSL